MITVSNTNHWQTKQQQKTQQNLKPKKEKRKKFKKACPYSTSRKCLQYLLNYYQGDLKDQEENNFGSSKQIS